MIEDFLTGPGRSLMLWGLMSQPEREEFELILEFHGELRELVCELEEVGAAVAFSRLPDRAPAPPAELKIKGSAFDRRSISVDNSRKFCGNRARPARSVDQSRLYPDVWLYARRAAREKPRTDFAG